MEAVIGVAFVVVLIIFLLSIREMLDYGFSECFLLSMRCIEGVSFIPLLLMID
jgi:hypothetical protein